MNCSPMNARELMQRMLTRNKPLYEKILDSNIAYEFNELCKLAFIASQSTETIHPSTLEGQKHQ